MSTPGYMRKPATLQALKDAKLVEEYTIKKVCNDKCFSKKKYRRWLSSDLVQMAKDCYTYLIKAYYTDNFEKALDYKEEALLNVEAMLAQLDVANGMYETNIPNLDYWAGILTDLKDSIIVWKKNTKMQ